MAILEHPDYDNHEFVNFHNDPVSGLTAIIAVHNTFLGPSLGGCRMFNYVDSAAALTDVLRLSKGMTYKAALASLPMGGGKSVIIGDSRQGKTPEMMQAMGRFVEKLGGTYIVAEDSGIAVSDVHEMAKYTQHAGGINAKFKLDGSPSDGNPAPSTAYGIFVGIKAAVQHKFGSDLKGKSIAIKGVGHVGLRLAEYLHKAGATLFVSDIHVDNLLIAQAKFNATIVDVAAIDTLPVDVFAPCALGNAINWQNIEHIDAGVIAGAANNQLETPALAERLQQRGILYAPDYVINAGGIIDIYHQSIDSNPVAMKLHLETIGDTLTSIFEQSEEKGKSTAAVADEMAELRFKPA